MKNYYLYIFQNFYHYRSISIKLNYIFISIINKIFIIYYIVYLKKLLFIMEIKDGKNLSKMYLIKIYYHYNVFKKNLKFI